ncbi:MAG: hypothetical protein M3044_00170 [Thermoproteota archaeon]|nr:hypothetical protein [Thermoproteota archaeon]
MFKKPAQTPTKLESRPNSKILVLILALTIIYQFASNVIKVPIGPLDIYQLSLTSGVGIVAISAFIVSRSYWGTEAFGKAYFSLGMAYTVYAIGDIIYYYEAIVMKVHPYPSIADIFYFAFYPFAIFHLIRNVAFFQRKIDVLTKIWLAGIPIAILLVYSYSALKQYGGANLDYYYGLIFTAGAATTFSFSLLGALVFRRSSLAAVWALIAAGIFIITVADVWYYYLEIFSAYTTTHVVNALWAASFMVIIYALYKHRKVI